MACLGLIAGGGGLPATIARAREAQGLPVFVIRLKGSAGPELAGFPGAEVGLAELNQCLKALRGAGCDQVCFAGNVRRPDFSGLKPDLKALRYLPGVIAAAGKGDDALLRAILAVFEAEGFQVVAAQDAAEGLTLAKGPLGAVIPGAADDADIRQALEAAREVGHTDIGQAAVVRGGQVIATEGHDGTDAMLRRLIEAQGTPSSPRRGVLAKVPKPAQDRRVDLPTIGVPTIERAAEAGLAGVVGEAGAMLVVDREAVREAADKLGLFVCGV